MTNIPDFQKKYLEYVLKSKTSIESIKRVNEELADKFNGEYEMAENEIGCCHHESLTEAQKTLQAYNEMKEKNDG